MEFIDIPTEQTTAVTDLILAATSFGSALHLRRYRIANPWKANLWVWAFGLLSLASALGAVAHGLKLSLATNRLLWQPLNIALGLAIALFVVGAVYDLWGRRVAGRMLPIVIGIGLAFFAVTQIVTGTFLVLVIYEVVAMLVALIIYTLTETLGPTFEANANVEQIKFMLAVHLGRLSILQEWGEIEKIKKGE